MSLEEATSINFTIKAGDNDCIITSITLNKIKCKTQKMAGVLKVKAEFNGKTALSSLLTLQTSPGSVVSITPSTYNPVEKTDLRVLLDVTAVKDKLKVSLVKNVSGTGTELKDPIEIQMRIISVESDNKTLVVKYPGAPSNKDSEHYMVVVTHADTGYYASTVQFKAQVLINSITPV